MAGSSAWIPYSTFTEESMRAVAEARAVAVGPGLPVYHLTVFAGVPAILARIRLAATVAAGDPWRARAAADALLTMGGAAAVWAHEARRVAAAFPEAAR